MYCYFYLLLLQYSPCSDLLAIVAAYDGWLDARTKGYNAESRYADENFLSLRTLRTMEKLRMDFCKQLNTAGLLTSPETNDNDDDDEVENGAKALSRQGGGVVDLEKSLLSLVEEASTNRAMGSLLRCVLVAGLYPHVGMVGNAVSAGVDPKLLTGPGQECFLMPSSVNAGGSGGLATKLFVYHERMKSKRVQIRDCTPVTPPMVLMFGGELSIDHEKEIVVVGDWLAFKADKKTAVMFTFLRRALDHVLADRVKGYGKTDESTTSRSKKQQDLVLSTIVTLLGGGK
jgi:hypothetical protein